MRPFPSGVRGVHTEGVGAPVEHITAITAVATTQHGLVHLDQLRRLAPSEWARRRMVRDGWLVPVAPRGAGLPRPGTQVVHRCGSRTVARVDFLFEAYVVRTLTAAGWTPR